MLAEMGEHQLTIRDYLLLCNLHVTNKYLQAAAESKRLARRQAGGCDFAYGVFRRPSRRWSINVENS
jgi:hypothetical protein